MQLEILPSDKIDKEKWDDCILNSNTPLIYATSVYLDCMADNWDGIIAEDYSFVMPVPWRKKYSIRYCYNVPFIQQLGVFGKNLREEDLNELVTNLRKFCKYGDYAFNYSNVISYAAQRNNYILILSAKYEVLKQFYSSNLVTNLSKINKHELKYAEGEANEAISLFRNLYTKRFPHVTTNDYKNFTALCKLKEQENNLVVRKVESENEILSSALFLKDERRFYNLMPSTTEKGRQLSAGHYLFDSLIQEFSHTGMIFDFEGSDIPGVEKFYKSFGAVNQPYFKMHINRLPILLRFFKR
jgi:hypothetical protein